MARKIFCENSECNYWRHNNKCTCDKIVINSDGCNSFQKGLVYYFHLVWRELEHSNFIDMCRMSDDLRIGIYYVTRVFKLGFSVGQINSIQIITLRQGEDGEPLTYDDIQKIGMDDDEWDKVYAEFKENGVPKIEKETPKKESQPFGWLSPTGEFTIGKWGDHEEKANEIIEKRGFTSEFEKISDNDFGYTARDFLSEVKGYVLVHNPSMSGGYQVSYQKPLTKKQREFLYNYFIDIGDKFRAETFLEE